MTLNYLLLFAICIVCKFNLMSALKLPGPRVYVVTPAPKVQIDGGRAAPFYYHNWMRRMDPPINKTTTTTPKQDTHDLIFAEFESDKGDNTRKSIRKLLEKERLDLTSTTPDPLPVLNEKDVINPLDQSEIKYSSQNNHFSMMKEKDAVKEDMFHSSDQSEMKYSSQQEDTNKMVDFMSMYNNNLYTTVPTPVYSPSTTTALPWMTQRHTTTTAASTAADNMDVKNVWHVIDDEKYNQYPGKWEEQEIAPQDDTYMKNTNSDKDNRDKNKDTNNFNNFELPGFTTNSGNRGENESRAIRTESNLQFPYAKLKTMQMKNPFMNDKTMKKGNNLYTNLDNFQDVKYPIRGEAQDVVPNLTPIDRYNSAIPYFPTNQKNSKQSSKPTANVPAQSVGSLVPPPPPSFGYRAPPSTYESFPPYPPSFSAPPAPPPAPQAPSAPVKSISSEYIIPPSNDDSDPPSVNSDDLGPPTGYQYSQPSSKFVPTLAPPPPAKNNGYTYDKPPPFKGYSYDKPPAASDDPPSFTYDSDHDHHHHEHHDHHDHHDHPDPPHDTPDYPELIFDKHKGGSDDSKVNDDMHGDPMDMAPPPPPDDKPMDHGFPHDFPGDFKYQDADEYYHDHHHYHPPPETSTTEMPRVNRYSYYYLGKKLYYIPLYFSAYFVAYVASLVIKSILRHKIVYPNSYKPHDSTHFFSKRSVDSSDWDFSSEKLHEVTRVVSNALYIATEKYMNAKK